MKSVISVIEERLEEPSSKALAAAVSRAIRDGALIGGDRLPPIRQLAHELALSPTTVSAAWTLLTRAGTIRTDGRRGTQVVDPSATREGRYRQALEQTAQFAVDLSSGVPDARLLPPLTRALDDLTTAGTPRSYLADPVLPELRAALRTDWPYPAPALTVCDGAMDAIELVIRSRLSYGDRVLVEQPTFPPLLDLLEVAGVSVQGIELDEAGIRPDQLAEALREPAQALFLQPRAQNPTGVALTAQRVDELAGLLAGRGVLVVEDDSANQISVAADLSLGVHLPEETVHIRSYSKSHGPDLRLAAVSGPIEVIAAIEQVRQLGQGWSSRLLQRVLVNLLADPEAGAAVVAARQVYAERRAAFCAVLASHGIETGGSDGINVWVPVLDESAALMRLAAAGIGVTPGSPFQVGGEGPPYLRVTTGLLAEDLDFVAAQVAAAALTGGHRVAR